MTITVKFGASGVTEFNTAAFFLDALLDPHFSMDLSETVLRLKESKTNYIELTGSFVATESENPLDYVNGITGYKVVVDGKVNYEISGLEIDHETLSSFKKLGRYLDSSDFQITGSDSANKLTSGGGADLLNGGKGNDRLTGNEGDDRLIGGAGVDTFVFTKGDGEDTINDFVAIGKHHEHIDLSNYSEDGLKFRDLDISRQGRDVLIELDRGDEILLKGVNIKHVDAHDFNF